MSIYDAPEQTIDEVWEEYKNSQSQDLRDRLILHYAPLVKYVASRVSSGLPASVEQADLASYGVFGLMDAITKFDPLRKIKFETYAASRIRGAIIDGLRAFDWVPRSVRSKIRRVERAVTTLENRLLRTPTDEEIAAHLTLSLPELRDVYDQMAGVSVTALDTMLTGEEGMVSLVETIEDRLASDPQSEAEEGEERRAVVKAIDLLPERERKIVTLYYYEGLTLAQIGEILGVSESRVSQIHGKAVLSLKARLGAQAGFMGAG